MVQQGCHRLPQQRARGSLVEPGLVRDAQRQVERGGGHPVWRIRREHDALGGHAREQLDHVDREEAGDVVQHARMVGQARCEDALVADGAVRQDQHRLGMAQRELHEAVGERRQPAPGVDEDRNARTFRQAEHVAHLAAVEHEVLRPWVELDAARSRLQAALALGERAFGGVQATERHQPPAALARPLQHTIVGHAIGRAALGVVQREHARAPRSRRVELREQLLRGERASVLVEPEMRVRVQHLCIGRPQSLDFR